MGRIQLSSVLKLGTRENATMAVTIRNAIPDDFQAICNLIPSAEELFYFYPKGRYPLTPDQLQGLVERRIDPVVLLTEGRVAGFADLYGLRKRKSVFVGNVVVDPSLRGRGLGKRMIVHMVDLAFRKHDLPRVRISVHGRNTAALLLYWRLGFKPYAIEEENDFRGERAALIHMRMKRE